ncbi:MAG: hypothetical protein A2579_05965 [Lysobacterales bacterium RIFOXYD1_FULL_69_11]|nr:MAG: hypothetical protein A2190_12065 [Xanthomonadales bacterium RIFOXYA1_FULL_69_10]OHE87450.1 MAG: hypothetical protein A2579_05965 [Xanthomonadales bacterium RIFOXYD1_FULL_69_11]
MQITDLLRQSGGLSSMARELGLSEQQATTGASALLPAILGGMRKRAQASPQGTAGLGGLLEQLGGGGLMDEVLSPRPTPVAHGNTVLGEIFGSKDVSRAVAGHASARTGLDSSVLKKMLPMLAMLAAGYLARQGGAGGSSGGVGGLLGGLMGGGGAAGAGGGLGGLVGLLDADGEGNPLDDILARINR